MMFGGRWRNEPQPEFAWAGEPGAGDFETWRPWAPGGWGGPRDRRWGPRPGPWMWRMGRRFPFGPGMGPGPFGPGMGPRMFGRGDLKYALLELLQERPKHGYEMIKELEDRSGGFYTPSAGAIYPTLQLLEDRGWVTAETVEGKKVYAITDVGKAALAERGERSESMGGPGFWGGPRHGPHHGPFGRETRPELRALRHEGMEVARLLRAAVLASRDDPERLARLRAIIARTRDDLNAFLGQGQRRAQEGPGATPGSTGSAGEGPVEHL